MCNVKKRPLEVTFKQLFEGVCLAIKTKRGKISYVYQEHETFKCINKMIVNWSSGDPEDVL